VAALGGMVEGTTNATAVGTEDTLPVTAVVVVAGMGAAGGEETDLAPTPRAGAALPPAPAHGTAAPLPRAALGPAPLAVADPVPTHKRPPTAGLRNACDSAAVFNVHATWVLLANFIILLMVLEAVFVSFNDCKFGDRGAIKKMYFSMF